MKYVAKILNLSQTKTRHPSSSSPYEGKAMSLREFVFDYHQLVAILLAGRCLLSRSSCCCRMNGITYAKKENVYDPTNRERSQTELLLITDSL